MAENYQIQNVREIPSGDPNRIGRLDLMIVYKKENNPANLVTIPAEDVKDKDEAGKLEAIKKAIQENEQKQASLIGKNITF